MDGLNKGYCLVLSGGGAKGVYHIGVWRALRQLEIEVTAFVGTSIGALMAALLAQGADEALEQIARTISLGSILALPREVRDEGQFVINQETLGAVPRVLAAVLKRGGLDTSPLRQLIDTYVDEPAIRRSGRDLGIVTVNRSDWTPQEIFLDAMEEGQLAGYLLASSAFPGFESPVIAGKRYLDGGLYDNVPYALARRRGYNRVIVSDVTGPGRNRKPEVAGALTVWIRNSVKMGGPFDFRRQFLDDFTRLGTLDTLRAFGRLGGRRYFLENGPEGAIGPWDPLSEARECAAAILDVERVATYRTETLEAAIERQRAVEDAKFAAFVHENHGGKWSLARVRQAVADRHFDGTAYFLWRLTEELLPPRSRAVLHRTLERFRPELPAGLSFLARG